MQSTKTFEIERLMTGNQFAHWEASKKDKRMNFPDRCFLSLLFVTSTHLTKLEILHRHIACLRHWRICHYHSFSSHLEIKTAFLFSSRRTTNRDLSRFSSTSIQTNQCVEIIEEHKYLIIIERNFSLVNDRNDQL